MSSLFSGYENLIGGFSAGFVSTVVCHPLDLLKIRYSGTGKAPGLDYMGAFGARWKERFRPLLGGFAQLRSAAPPPLPPFGGFAASQLRKRDSALRVLAYNIPISANEGNALRPQYSSYMHAARSIVAAEGVRGIYQGLTPNIIGATLSWGLYFQFYYTIRSKVTLFPDKFQSVNDLITGILSGSAVMCFTNPIWVTKTRLCLQYETEGPKKYHGMVDCMKQIMKNEGINGLYKGFIPGLLGTTHGAVQFMAYNYLKDRKYAKHNIPKDSKLSTVDVLTFSILSKVFATTTTYPYQVLRTRLQDQHVKYNGVVDCLKATVKGEGVSGLYKGMMMANIRVLPAAMVTFVTYENVKHFLAN